MSLHPFSASLICSVATVHFLSSKGLAREGASRNAVVGRAGRASQRPWRSSCYHRVPQRFWLVDGSARFLGRSRLVLVICAGNLTRQEEVDAGDAEPARARRRRLDPVDCRSCARAPEVGPGALCLGAGAFGHGRWWETDKRSKCLWSTECLRSLAHWLDRRRWCLLGQPTLGEPPLRAAE